jgi:hypothetical protein
MRLITTPTRRACPGGRGVPRRGPPAVEGRDMTMLGWVGLGWVGLGRWLRCGWSPLANPGRG